MLFFVLLSKAQITITGGVGGFVFKPLSDTVAIGEKVTITLTRGHNLRTGIIPEGAMDFSADFEGTVEYIPTIAGKYNFYCQPHEYLGMYGSFFVKEDPYIKVTTPKNLSFCGEALINVSITSNVVFENANNFKVQLSDYKGSFDFLTEIMPTLSGINNISFVLPQNVPAGDQYKFRITSSSPFIIGSPIDSPIKINFVDTTRITISQYPNGDVCSNTPLTITAINKNTVGINHYNWIVNGVALEIDSPIFYPTSFNNNDIIKCVMTAQSSGCISPLTTMVSNEINISTKSKIVPATSITGNLNACTGNYSISANSTGGGGYPTYEWSIPGVTLDNNKSNIDLTEIPQFAIVKLISDLSCADPKTITSSVFIPDAKGVLCEKYVISSLKNSVLTLTSLTLGAKPTFINWYRNGKFISSGEEHFLNVSMSGTYMAIYGGASCCSVTSSGYLFDYLPQQIEYSTVERSYTISPIPIFDILHITFNDVLPNDLEIVIYNINGESRLNRKYQKVCIGVEDKVCTCSKNVELDLSTFESGTYIVKLLANNLLIGSRLVIKQ